MTLTNVLQLVFALGLLLLGRKLYWLFVGAVGFIAVTELVLTNFAIQQEWIVVLVGLAAGILGAVLAIFIRMAGIGLAGILGGMYVISVISGWASLQNPTLNWIILALGGAAGLLLVFLLFDWALIIISSLTGAVLLSNLAPIPGQYAWLVTGVLLVVGVIVQSRIMEPAGD